MFGALIALCIAELNGIVSFSNSSLKDHPIEAQQSASESSKLVMKAMSYLKRAYDLQPNHPVILVHLANHFFYRRDYSRTIDLSVKAYHNTENSKVKAEACFHIARCHHAKSDYENAFTYYWQSVNAWPEFPLAQFGLGQMYLARKDIANAVSCFEKVNSSTPNNYETLKES